MYLKYDRVRELVRETAMEFHVPYAAIDSISFCIISHWNMRHDLKWFYVSSVRKELLKDESPTTRCLKKALELMEKHPDRFFGIEVGPSMDEIMYKPTPVESVVLSKTLEKKEKKDEQERE